MTPIVFWASLVPCASAISEPVPIWPQRNPPVFSPSPSARVTRKISQVATMDTVAAMTGEARDGRITLPTTPSSLVPSPVQWTPPQPMPAIVAPIRPPKSACDELEGRPSSHVTRFQMMPPTRPARMISSRADPWSAVSAGSGAPLESWIETTALVTVSATATDRNAPTRLRTAARATAVLGLRAPVAMVVAIEFPVSWNPLVKSNPRATITTRMTVSSCADTELSVGPRGDCWKSPRASSPSIRVSVHLPFT